MLLDFEYFRSSKWISNIFSITITNNEDINEIVKLNLALGYFELQRHFEIDLSIAANIFSLQKLEKFVKQSNIEYFKTNRFIEYIRVNYWLKFLFQFRRNLKSVIYEKITIPKNSIEQADLPMLTESYKSKKKIKNKSKRKKRRVKEIFEKVNHEADKEQFKKENKEEYKIEDKKELEILKFSWYTKKYDLVNSAIFIVKSVNPLILKDEKSEALCETSTNINQLFKFFSHHVSESQNVEGNNTDLKSESDNSDEAFNVSHSPSSSNSLDSTFLNSWSSDETSLNSFPRQSQQKRRDTSLDRKHEKSFKRRLRDNIFNKMGSIIRGKASENEEEKEEEEEQEEQIMKKDAQKSKEKQYFSDYLSYFKNIYSFTKRELYLLKMKTEKNVDLLHYRFILFASLIIKTNSLTYMRKVKNYVYQYYMNRYAAYKNFDYTQKTLFNNRNLYNDEKHYFIKKQLEFLLNLTKFEQLKLALNRENVLENFLEDLSVEISDLNRNYYTYFYTGKPKIYYTPFYLKKLKNISRLCPLLKKVQSQEQLQLLLNEKKKEGKKLILTDEIKVELEQCEKRVGIYGSYPMLNNFQILDNFIGKHKMKEVAFFSYQCEKSVFGVKGYSELSENNKNVCLNPLRRKLYASYKNDDSDLENNDEIETPTPQSREKLFKPKKNWINMITDMFSSTKSTAYSEKLKYGDIKCFGIGDLTELINYQKKKDAKCKIEILNINTITIEKFLDEYYKIESEGITSQNAMNVYSIYKHMYTTVIFKLVGEAAETVPLFAQQKLSTVGNKYVRLLYDKKKPDTFFKYIVEEAENLYKELELMYYEHTYLKNISFPKEAIDITMFNYRPFDKNTLGYRIYYKDNEKLSEGEENKMMYTLLVLYLLGGHPDVLNTLLSCMYDEKLIMKLLDMENVEDIDEEKEKQTKFNKSKTKIDIGNLNSDSASSTTETSDEETEAEVDAEADSTFRNIYNFLFGNKNRIKKNIDDYLREKTNKMKKKKKKKKNIDEYLREKTNKMKKKKIKNYEINDFKWMSIEQIEEIKIVIKKYNLISHYINGLQMMKYDTYVKGENYLKIYKMVFDKVTARQEIYQRLIKTSPMFNFFNYKISHLVLFAFYYGLIDLFKTRKEFVSLELQLNKMILNNEKIFLYRTQKPKSFHLSLEKRKELGNIHDMLTKFIYMSALQHRKYLNDNFNEPFYFNQIERNNLKSIIQGEAIINQQNVLTPTASYIKWETKELDEAISFLESVSENFILQLMCYPVSLRLKARQLVFEDILSDLKTLFFSFKSENNLMDFIKKRDITYSSAALNLLKKLKTRVSSLAKVAVSFLVFAIQRRYKVDLHVSHILHMSDQDVRGIINKTQNRKGFSNLTPEGTTKTHFSNSESSGFSSSGELFTNFLQTKQKKKIDLKKNDLKKVIVYDKRKFRRQHENPYSFILLQKPFHQLGSYFLEGVMNTLLNGKNNLMSNVTRGLMHSVIKNALTYFDNVLSYSVYFHKSEMFLEKLSLYSKKYLIYFLDLILLDIRNGHVMSTITKAGTTKHAVFNICLFQMQSISVLLKNILNVLYIRNIEDTIFNLIVMVYTEYASNRVFIDSLLKQLDDFLSKYAIVKNLFGKSISYMLVAYLQMFDVLFHPHYRKKTTQYILYAIKEFSYMISDIVGEAYFQSYICSRLIELGDSIVKHFNLHFTFYDFFMDVADSNFIDLYLAYIINYLPQMLKNFIDVDFEDVKFNQSNLFNESTQPNATTEKTTTSA